MHSNPIKHQSYSMVRRKGEKKGEEWVRMKVYDMSMVEGQWCKGKEIVVERVGVG